MRTIVPFNDDWLFLAEQVSSEVPDSAFAAVTLPHTNKIFPHHNFDNADYQFISTYRKHFALPEPRNGRRVLLDFEGAMIAATVTVNGHTFPEHPGGYTPFSVDITDAVRDDGDNLLTVRLDSTERDDIPPYGFVVDYLTFGGIYRDVWLRMVEPVHIDRVFVHPVDVLTDQPQVVVDVWIANQGDRPARCTLHAAIRDLGVDSDLPVDLPAHATTQATLILPGAGCRLWSPDDPALYTCAVQIDDQADRVEARFGFREAEFRPDGGFYLNGERLNLIGLNRHQTYPYIGAAAPPRLQRQDAEIVKWELGCSIVRTSHYPQSRYFLDRCDEIGLLVFEEIPGWQHIGDEDWQAISLRDVRAMIERDCNHPSIILWGVRINESLDSDAFYTATNALAHQIDPTRQTGGVRYFQDSQFLEDVFTFNDFSDTVVDPIHTPHLITEFGGHMFPTKIWDHEERVIEHALRHARVQDRQLGLESVAGAIGWCAFDYNTHQQFGSGDRVCYHGVMDMFRLPKYAAYVYASQVPPQQRIVLQPATLWVLGDRNTSQIDKLVILSNCDTVEVTVGETCLGRFEPDRISFPNLPHPPFQIPMANGNLSWGQEFPDLHVVGYVEGQAVAEHHIDARSLPDRLVLHADYDELIADGADMTRLVFKIVDRCGNRLPYTNQPVFFEIEGPGELIGENPFAIMGGQAAMYVRAGHQPGRIAVRAVTPRLDAATVTITVKAR